MLEKAFSIIVIHLCSVVSLVSLGILIGMNLNDANSLESSISIIVSSAVALLIFYATQYISQRTERVRTLTSKFEDLHSYIQSIKFYLKELDKTRHHLMMVDLDEQRRSRDLERLKQLYEILDDKHSKVFTIINVHFISVIQEKQKIALQEHYRFISSQKSQRSIDYLALVQDNPLTEVTYIDILESILEAVRKKYIKNAL